MGSFTFKWEHPADEVYVTGTFDNWTKSVKLEKEGNVFSKTVDLKEPEGKIYYKVRERQRASTRNVNSFPPFRHSFCICPGPKQHIFCRSCSIKDKLQQFLSHT
ncbi:hypothetical protein IL306_012719 [Fusarium sp. DS 682]|nr:hypothetical protein IL306_012719 [Fusarium sp. DS 682]